MAKPQFYGEANALQQKQQQQPDGHNEKTITAHVFFRLSNE